MVDFLHTNDDLVDVLLDLKHDLGKYLLLPVAMLPEPASRTELAEAVDAAIHRTRKSRGSVRSGREIWEEYHAELAPWQEAPWFPELVQTVDRALHLDQAMVQENLGRTDCAGRLGALSTLIVRILQEMKE